MTDWNHGSDMFGEGWIAMTLMMGLVWGLLILAGAVAYRTFRQATTPTNHASEILDERFARGELDETEYDARKAVLGGKR